jgi:hypothetical protein
VYSILKIKIQMLKYIVMIVLTLSIVDTIAQSDKNSRFGVHLGFGYQESLVPIKEVNPIVFDNFDIGINSFDGLYADLGLVSHFKKHELGLVARFCFVREEVSTNLPPNNVVRVIPHAFWVHYFGGSGGELFRGGLTGTLMTKKFIVNRLPGTDPNISEPVDRKGTYLAFGGIIGIRLIKSGVFKNIYANFNLQVSPPIAFEKATIVNPGWLWNTTIGLSKPIYFKQKSK